MPSNIPRREDGSIDVATVQAVLEMHVDWTDFLHAVIAAAWNDGNANQDTLAVNPYDQEAGEDE